MDSYIINLQTGDGNTNVISDDQEIEELKSKIKCLEKDKQILTDIIKGLRKVITKHLIKAQ